MLHLASAAVQAAPGPIVNHPKEHNPKDTGRTMVHLLMTNKKA